MVKKKDYEALESIAVAELEKFMPTVTTTTTANVTRITSPHRTLTKL